LAALYIIFFEGFAPLGGAFINSFYRLGDIQQPSLIVPHSATASFKTWASASPLATEPNLVYVRLSALKDRSPENISISKLRAVGATPGSPRRRRKVGRPGQEGLGYKVLNWSIRCIDGTFIPPNLGTAYF
jgi:hypothetical protein